MNYIVESFLNFENQRCLDLIESGDGLPVCFWLSAHLREFQNSSTATTHAYQAKFYMEYFSAQGIDIVERVENGKFFSKTELEDFLRTCFFHKDKTPTSTSNIINVLSTKSLDNLMHATFASQSKVSSSTSRIRIAAFQKYIEFLHSYIHSDKRPTRDVLLNFGDCIAYLKNATKRFKSDNTVVKDPFEQAIPTDVYFQILEITKPSSPNNPWSKRSRLRNHIIVQLFNETGIRRGALCKIKLSDLRTDQLPRIRITRTPNDITDKRKRPAAQKTKAQTVPISAELMKCILLYVDTDRSKYSQASNHDFLFVAEKGETSGQPISLITINYLINKLSKAVNFNIYPHLMRHKFNELFTDAASERGLDGNQTDDLRKFACGWSEKSTMPSRYNAFKTAVTAAAVSKKIQQSILSGVPELKHDN